MNKNISVGIGVSKKKNAIDAANEAAKMALKKLGGKKPTISYVFFAGEYDPYKLSEGLSKVLKGTDFIGGSTDRIFYNTDIIETGVLVLSIQSDYLHVGIASSDNVSKNPFEITRKTVKNALKEISIDNYVDPYLMFNRMKKANVEWMVKIPSFFVNIFSRGMRLPVMGDETKIISGVCDVIGSNIPIYGASFGADAIKPLSGKPYEIYTLHNGTVMKDGLIIIFNTTSLVYGQSLEHGCKRTNKFGFISKTHGNGYVVDEISEKESSSWYAEQLKMSKDEFVKNSMLITHKYPLGIPDEYGKFIIRGGGIYNNNSLSYVAPLVEGWPVYIMDASPENLMSASKSIAGKIREYTSLDEKPAICIATLCLSRRLIFKEKLKDELKQLQKEFKGAPLVGFSCFGEIGSSPGMPPKFQHMSSNIFVLYDKLLHTL